MYLGFNVKYTLFLSDFIEDCIFSTNFQKNLQIPSLMKIRPEGAELLHEDGQTDMTKVIVTFRSFA